MMSFQHGCFADAATGVLKANTPVNARAITSSRMGVTADTAL
jgi:hypothetical protein